MDDPDGEPGESRETVKLRQGLERDGWMDGRSDDERIGSTGPAATCLETSKLEERELSGAEDAPDRLSQMSKGTQRRR